MLWEMVIDGMEVPEDSPARDHVAELLGRIAARVDRACQRRLLPERC